MDYRLKSIYDQMLRGATTKQNSARQQPKNLTEAYKTVLTERVALYAKNIGDEKTAPAEPGMETLGVADNTEFVQSALNSVTIKPATDELLAAAGKWQTVDDYEDSLMLPISMVLAKQGLSSNDVYKLIEKKSTLTSFTSWVAAETAFNSRREVSADLKKLFPTNEHLEYIYDYVFLKKPKISDVGVGMGEVALSIFTDCIKGKVGDLDSSIGPIEVKSTGGRLASPKQVNHNYAKDLAQFLINNKAVQVTSRKLHNLKNALGEDVKEILAKREFKDKFTSKFFSFVQFLLSSVESEKFEDLYKNSVFALSMAGPKKLFSEYLTRGYIVFDDQTIGSEASIKQIKNVWESEISVIVAAINKEIRETFIENVFKKTTTGRKLDYALATRQDIKDIARATSPLVALEEFYFTNFGLSSEQKAAALTLIVSEAYRPIAVGFIPEITKFFETYKNLFDRGSASVIKAMVFAMQVSVYASNHFNYILLVSKENKNAIGIKANSFYHLATKYFQASKEMNVSIGVDIDQERGGSSVDMGKKDLSVSEQQPGQQPS